MSILGETSERRDVPESRLVGRDDLLSGLRRTVLAGDQPLILLAGERGVGRSRVLAELRRSLQSGPDPVRVLSFTVGLHDREVPYAALYRFVAELESEPGSLANLSDRIARLSGSSELRGGGRGVAVDGLVDMIDDLVRPLAPAVVLVDDADHVDDASLVVADLVVERLGRRGCVVIAAVHESRPERSRPLRGEVVAVRPLGRAHSRTLIASLVGAAPGDGLVESLHRATGGNPQALIALVAAHRADDAMVVVDRTAYLLPDAEFDIVRPHAARWLREITDPLRRVGGSAWAFVKALALLCPLGADAVSLASSSIGTPPDVAAQVMALLARSRVVVPAGAGWRFRKPLVRACLRHALGHVERQTLAADAVNALWNGQAHTDDERVLPELIIDAGGLIDQERAVKELMAYGGTILYADPLRAEKVFAAIVDHQGQHGPAAVGLIALSAARAVRHNLADAASSAYAVLTRHAATLPPDLLQELQVIYVLGLAAAQRGDALVDIAEGRTCLVVDHPAQRVVTRAICLVLLARWAEGRELLLREERLWRTANLFTAEIGATFVHGSGVVLGDPGTFLRHLADEHRWSAVDLPLYHYEQVRFEAEMLLVLGEARAAVDLVAARGMTVDMLGEQGRFMVHWLGGQWQEAIEAAHRGIMAGLHRYRPPAGAVMVHGSAYIAIAKGWLGRARDWLATGRSDHLPYLNNHVQSILLRVFGRHREADSVLKDGLRLAEAGQYAMRTEYLLTDLARSAMATGDHALARDCLARIAELARGQDTGQCALALALTEGEVLGDPAAFARAIGIARDRGIPHELGVTLLRTVKMTPGGPGRLIEAYEIFGDLGALLWRSKVRSVARLYGVAVPGRAATTAENELLLATLIADGLSNREIAAVLRVTDKSIEARLTRTLAKTGYRSRVELATAVITGEFPGSRPEST